MTTVRSILDRMSDSQPRRVHTEIFARVTLVLLSVIAAFGIASGVHYRLQVIGIIGYILAGALTMVVGVILHTVGYKLIMMYERAIILQGPVWLDGQGEYLYLFDHVKVDGRNIGFISGRDHDGNPTVTLIGQDHGQSYPPSRLEYRKRSAQ